MKTTVVIHALRLHEGRAQHPGGNYHHVELLLRALLPRAEAAGFRIIVLVDELGLRDLGRHLPREALFPAGKSSDGILRSDINVRRIVRELGATLYYRPTGQLPFGRLPCKTIMGVADLNFRWISVPLLRRIYKELSYRWSLYVADRVVCISDFTRSDVQRFAPTAAPKLRVIHHGAPMLPLFTQHPLSRYWLTFGHQAHKNVELCLQALTLLKREERDDELIVIGQSDHIERVLKPMADSLGVSDRVRFAGQVSAVALCEYYSGARGLLFVSKFEGFGLPLLEAMAIGCPVIAGRVCSLPEVAAEAALYVEVDNAAELAQAMRSVTSDNALAADLRAKGLVRAKFFTWEAAADRTLDVFRELVPADTGSQALGRLG